MFVADRGEDQTMSHARSWLVASFSAVVALAGAGCSNQTGGTAAPADTRAADEAAIRAATGTFDQGIAAKDLDKAVSSYQDDAVLFAPKAPAAVGIAAIREAWKGLLGVPGLKMTLNIASVDIARSGDLAVERGTFQIDTTDKDGKPASELGHFVIAWKKQADGSWKVTADTNADDK